MSALAKQQLQAPQNLTELVELTYPRAFRDQKSVRFTCDAIREYLRCKFKAAHVMAAQMSPEARELVEVLFKHIVEER